MKKIKTKIIIRFGATTTFVATSSIILSCGNSNSNPGPNQSELNAKLNAVTATMVANYVKAQTNFIPSATVDVPAAAPSKTLTKVTLNGVGGLTIAISNWTANATLGSVTFDVFIFDEGLTTKAITGVTYDGWITTDQKALNEVTAEMVATYVKMWALFIPSSTADVPKFAPSSGLTNATLNGVAGLTIIISNWVANVPMGSVTFDASISKAWLKAKSVTGVTYDGWYSEQKELNAVTPKMVANYVKAQAGFVPSATVDAPTTAPSLTLNNVTLNGVIELTITISNWKANDSFGSVTFDVNIFKTGLKDRNIKGITYDGWYNDQKRLNGITTKMVVSFVKAQAGFAPSAAADVPATVPKPTLNNVTLHGLDGLTIIISNWKPNYINGSVTFDVKISKTGLKDKNIQWVNYNGYKSWGQQINNQNVNYTEGKLWSWNNNTLTIFDGIERLNDEIVWGHYDFHTLMAINFPDTLQVLDTNVFLGLSGDSLYSITFPASIWRFGPYAFGALHNTRLYFKGEVPTNDHANGDRYLSMGDHAFANTYTSKVFAGDSGVADVDWQNWANKYDSNHGLDDKVFRHD